MLYCGTVASTEDIPKTPTRRVQSALLLAGISIALPSIHNGLCQQPQSRAQPQPRASQLNSPRLLPMPREYSPRSTAALSHGVSITSDSDPDDRFTALDLSSWLKGLQVQADKGHAAFRIQLLRSNAPGAQKLLSHAEVTLDPQMHEEGYAILPTAHGAAVIADMPAGLFYGVQTLKQMIIGTGPSASIAKAQIRDWPAMRYRGVSDDLSRGPIPTLEFQKCEIRTLAAYKINLYSPYFESTFQYHSTPLAALPGGSLGHEDARTLVEYARHYHVMIVPEQEAFAHLHHLLTYEQYSPLAETPLGSVLAPGQSGSLDLIGQWFAELAQVFPAPFLHVGADETFDLGKGQTREAVNGQGLGAVYVDFLLHIHARLAPLNRRLLFWGDIAMKDPVEVKRLPKDLIAVAWTYDPAPAGYRQWLEPYIAAGMETWVAPGVSNWKRVFPDNSISLANIQDFVRDGQAAHSTGMLNTVWNDDGEGLFLEDWYGLLFGAAAAWQPGRSSIESFQASYGSVFHGDTTGGIDEAQRQLISVYQILDQAKVKEATDALFWADPWSPEGQAIATELRPLIPAIRLHAERAIVSLAQARNEGHLREADAIDAVELGARRLDFIGQKFETADEIALLYRRIYSSQNDAKESKEISRTLQNIAGANGLCQDLRDGYSFSRDQFSALWLKENRPYWLKNVQARYDLATQLWITRGDQFSAASNRWSDHRTLPSPQEMGLPATENDAATH